MNSLSKINGINHCSFFEITVLSLEEEWNNGLEALNNPLKLSGALY